MKYLYFAIATLMLIGVAAYLHTPDARAAVAGDLIKAQDDSTIYYLGSDNKLYTFPNETVFYSWYPDFNSVVVISVAKLQSYGPPKANVTIRPGTKLIKRPIPTAPEVYAVESGGKLRWIDSEATAKALYGNDWASRVIDVADSFFTNYRTDAAKDNPITANAYPEGTLVKWDASPNIYYITSDGTTRKIINAAAFAANHFQTNYVVTVPQSKYIPPSGTTIAAQEAKLADTSEQSIRQVAVAKTDATNTPTTSPATSTTTQNTAQPASGNSGGNSGNSGNSSATPASPTITTCTNSDGYCPTSCSYTNDNDCAVTGVIDLDVTYLERTPRYERYNVSYNATNLPIGVTDVSKRQPANGDTVIFTAHVINKGIDASPAANYQWKIDSVVKTNGTLAALTAGQATSTAYQWVWADNGSHAVSFTADSGNVVPETAETNNTMTNAIDAYALRIQVEQTVYDSFNAKQNVAGTKSFEDWLQAHIAKMNELIIQKGGLIRVRVDQITVAANDTLPNGGTHADQNWDWDGSWGFERDEWQPAVITQWVGNIQYPLIHELTHQIGVIDAYNLNYDWNYVTAHEIITLCASCPEGAYCGNQVATYQICTYANSGVAGLMGGGNDVYSAFDIGAMNATKGYRRGYFGEYLFDVPATNYFVITNQATGAPVNGADVTIYQGTNTAIKLSAIITAAMTGADGKVPLPNRPVSSVPTTATGHTLRPNPFGDISVVGANGILLIKITKVNATDYRYLDISEFNMKYWQGNTKTAQYTITTTIE